jgi:multidrug efflux pump subunit AcrB
VTGNLSEWALRHRVLVIYIMAVLVLLGALSYVRIGRSEDPAFTIKTMVVQAAWPGASLDETMQQVTDRLERTIQQVPNLDFIRSFTRPGVSTIFVNLREDTPASRVPDLWYEVRKKVLDSRFSLPQGVIGPTFDDDFGETFGIVYAFTADGFTRRELRDQVEDVRSRLLQVPDVESVELIGTQDERIFVDFSPELLSSLGLHPAALITALASRNAVRPAGAIETANDTMRVRLAGAFQSEQDIMATNFAAGGRIFRLSDLAHVHRGYADPPQPEFRVNGREAIGLAISMRKGGDIVALGRNVRRAMAEVTADLPVGIEPFRVADQAVTVHDAVNEFLRALGEAVAIVLVVSFLALGLRAGSVVAFAIPLTLAMVLPAMLWLGIDLQRVSLGALIIALGLLVDDATTTADVMVSRLQVGDDAQTAASFAYKSLAFPMLTGTFVTWAGFLPVGFARSSAGEYLYSMFVVVGLALVLSWVVAVIFTPLLGVLILRPPRQQAGPGPVIRTFRRVLEAAMRARWITIGATLGLFALALWGLRFVDREFFPASDRPELVIDLRLPQNASIHASSALATKLDAVLASDPDVQYWTTYVGRGAIRFYLPLNTQLPNDAISQTVVVAKDFAARQRLEAKLGSLLIQDFPSAVARVYPLGLGPSADWPIQYRVSGPDIVEVQSIALRVADVLGSDPWARRVNFDWIEPGRVIRVHVDQDKARLLGINSDELGGFLNAVLAGTTVTQVRDERYLVDVVVRAGEGRLSPAILEGLQVPIAGGRTVPLSQFATFGFEQEYPQVWRRDRRPTLTVQADVAPGAFPESVTARLADRIAGLNQTLPVGYAVAVGGPTESSADSRASIMAVVPAMLLVVVSILMIQLQSANRLLLVLSVAPLGMIGIVGGLLLSGRPLGFVAILGALSLVGMIARNAVILVEQIEAERTAGLAGWEAVIAAAESRMRPILLSAAATVLGMIPIAPTVFWGPMAFAVMGGFAAATVLTLLFLPALYVAWFGIREPGIVEQGWSGGRARSSDAPS